MQDILSQAVSSLQSVSPEPVFIKCVNLSISAGWLILAVILLRYFLKKAPRQLVCLLWMAVGLRLLCPFTFTSPFSLLPSAETVPQTILLSPAPAIDSGIAPVDAGINPILSAAFAPAPGDSVNPLQILAYIASRIWLAGMTVMLCFLFGSFLRLHRNLRTATLLRDNIRQSEFVDSPFILGIVKPQIYVPYGVNPEDLAHVLAHERAHLARKDHLLKPLAFLILSVYWFHPLVWASFFLFCKDLELACDESVIRSLDDDRRRSYSLALLHCTNTSPNRRRAGFCPLAFGELGVKERILRIKSYRRPTFVFVLAAVLVCGVTVCCLLTAPAERDDAEHADNTTAENSAVTSPDTEAEAEPKQDHDVRPDTDQNQNTGSDADNSTALSIFPVSDDIPIVTGLSQEEADAVTNAILSQNRSASTPQDVISCCSFVPLAVLSGTPAAGSSTHTIIYYGWVLYQEYSVTEKGIYEKSGSHIPVELTFELANDHHAFLPTQSVPLGIYQKDPGYVLKEYWTPGDGSYYVTDIQKHFPPHIQAEALDSQKYILPQKQSCYRQAVIAGGLNSEQVDKILENLLDTVCSPSAASDVQSYIDAHPIEYRELTFYGEYTLDYSERHPEQNLHGQILLRACEDIRNGLLPITALTARPD